MMDVQRGGWWALLFPKENVCSAVTALSKPRAPFVQASASLSAAEGLGI